MMTHMTRVVAHDDQCANLFRKAKQTLPYIGIIISFAIRKIERFGAAGHFCQTGCFCKMSMQKTQASHTIYMDFSGLLLPCTP